MGETVIVALITGGCALLGSVITVWASGNKTIYRIARVEEKVDRLEKRWMSTTAYRSEWES